MIPVLNLERPADRARVEELLRRLRLDPLEVALSRGHLGEAAAAVQRMLADVAQRGDAAVVEASRKFDDPNFSADQIRVSPEEMRSGAPTCFA